MKHITIITGLYLLLIQSLSTMQAEFFYPTEPPTGTIHLLEYHSTTMNETRRMQIYLPYEYDVKEYVFYPVLYLQHGGGDDETAWEQKGNAKTFWMLKLLPAKHCL